MVKNESRPVGRPPKFDRDETAAKLQHAFWRSGYAGASLEDLTRATGLHKPSLYGAFGDKRQMYMGALHSYLDANAIRFREAMRQPSLRESLTSFFSGSIEIFGRHADAPGCFLLATAVPMAVEDAEVGELVSGAFDGLGRLIARRLENARADGDLGGTGDLTLDADIVLATHFSLSARARTGATAASLQAQVERIIAFFVKSSDNSA